MPFGSRNFKVVHGFSLQQIGQIARIPFFAATLDNFVGGAAFRVILRLGFETAITRQIAILIFSALSLRFLWDRSAALYCVLPFR
jgi:hypothetical protein